MQWGTCPTLTLPYTHYSQAPTRGRSQLRPWSKEGVGQAGSSQGTRDRRSGQLRSYPREVVGSRTTCVLGLQASCACPIVPLNFTYKTEIQRQSFTTVTTEFKAKRQALLSARLWNCPGLLAQGAAWTHQTQTPETNLLSPWDRGPLLASPVGSRAGGSEQWHFLTFDLTLVNMSNSSKAPLIGQKNNLLLFLCLM